MKQINDLGTETSNTNLDGTIDPEAIQVECLSSQTDNDAIKRVGDIITIDLSKYKDDKWDLLEEQEQKAILANLESDLDTILGEAFYFEDPRDEVFY
ncbi:hypothetical protein ACN1NW_000430 [Acinetobacter baumannii]|nr:hypothetical protein [Acinetobacter baumannii]ELA7031016.1 hypothetical protein [Acinetobacter baumannii]ELA7118779.1 hypothetical protein [Acinetobacter baumannii]ELB0919728.1 hypothetical protein [Acinetobacter baumannii]ELB0965905.1 hypothetical protein [Acinetobacter baumannii]